MDDNNSLYENLLSGSTMISGSLFMSPYYVANTGPDSKNSALLVVVHGFDADGESFALVDELKAGFATYSSSQFLDLQIYEFPRDPELRSECMDESLPVPEWLVVLADENLAPETPEDFGDSLPTVIAAVGGRHLAALKMRLDKEGAREVGAQKFAMDYLVNNCSHFQLRYDSVKKKEMVRFALPFSRSLYFSENNNGNIFTSGALQDIGLTIMTNAFQALGLDSLVMSLMSNIKTRYLEIDGSTACFSVFMERSYFEQQFTGERALYKLPAEKLEAYEAAVSVALEKSARTNA